MLARSEIFASSELRAVGELLTHLASPTAACDTPPAATSRPAAVETTELAVTPTAIRGPSFMRGAAPTGRSASRYYFRPMTQPASAGDGDDAAFEKCAARCLSPEYAPKCWFISTSGERECTIHTGLFAFTSMSV